MGQAQSKADEPLVFNNPVQFDESMIRAMQARADRTSGKSAAPRAPSSPGPAAPAGASAATAPKLPSVPAAAPTLPLVSPEQMDKIVEERVQERLRKELSKNKARHGVLQDNAERLNSQVALREAGELLERAERTPLPTVVADPACIEAEVKVLECLRNNSGRSLDCWREVQQFKEARKKAQCDFLEAALAL